MLSLDAEDYEALGYGDLYTATILTGWSERRKEEIAKLRAMGEPKKRRRVSEVRRLQMKVWRKNWRERNRDKVRESNRKYRQTEKDKIRRKLKRKKPPKPTVYTDPEKRKLQVQAARKRWIEKNREKYNAYMREYRARKKRENENRN